MLRIALCLLFFYVCESLAASDAEGHPVSYPLWDGKETVAQYSAKTGLPICKTLDLGAGIKMELVLIPAGKFIMGTAKPDEPEITVLLGQIVLTCSAAIILFMVVLVIRGMRNRRSWRPQYSLGWLIIFVFVFNGVSWGGIRWWRANEYWKDFLFALENYERSFLCEKPAHGVTISAPFYMGKYEVTNEQYETVMGINPGKYLERNLPVGWLSFYDAQAFCQKVKEITGTKVRLPTEAEWEYACRAGTKSIFNSGNEIKDLMDSGWFENNSRGRAHPVGQKQPNAFALHDMHGNEREWCQDWYGEYTSSSKIDPQGPSHGPFRVLRGGHYSSEVLYCRSSMRINCELGNKYFSGGFRVVLCVR